VTWRHEVRMLWRDRAACVVLLMWCAALLYALATGWQVAEQTRVEAANFEKAALVRTEAQRAKVAQAELSGTVTDRFAGFPSTLRAPAVLPVSPLALLTVGEMDLQPHTATVSLFTPAGAAAKGQELQSPVSLAIGRFDLGFAVVMLMPLVLLARGHNQLAEDREQQRLPLLAAQTDVRHLLWRRLAWRGGAVVLPLLIVTGTAVWVQTGGASTLSVWSAWLAWTLPVLAWALFWLALCGAVGGRVASTGTAAAVLVSCWLLLVLLLPAALGALVQTVSPPPSPLLATSALRAAEVQADRDRERIFGRYISDHPELKISTVQDDMAWTRNYYAQMQFVESQLQPVRTQAAAAAQAHGEWKSALIWASPAQVVELALQLAAGTNAARYEAFAAQRAEFKKTWDAPLVAPLLAGQTVSAAGFKTLPRFVFSEPVAPVGYAAAAYVLMLAAALLLFLRLVDRESHAKPRFRAV